MYLKILKKTLRYSLVFIGLLIAGLFLWLNFGVYTFIDGKTRNSIINSIEEAPELPDNFMRVYTTLYPESINNSFYHLLYDSLKGEHYELLPRSVAYDFSASVHKANFFKWAAFSMYINNNTSREECLQAIMWRYDFTHNCIGVDQAAQFYYRKPLVSLNDDEMIGIIAMYKNPSLFNPLSNKKRFEDRVQTLKEKFKKMD